MVSKVLRGIEKIEPLPVDVKPDQKREIKNKVTTTPEKR